MSTYTTKIILFMQGILKIVIYYVNYVIFRHPTGLTNKRRHLISDIKNKSTTKNYPLFKEMGSTNVKHSSFWVLQVKKNSESWKNYPGRLSKIMSFPWQIFLTYYNSSFKNVLFFCEQYKYCRICTPLPIQYIDPTTWMFQIFFN